MTKKYHGMQHGISLKKQYGQHFLRDQSVIDHMLAAVKLDNNSSVFEIGSGDGFLTRSILEQPLARLWVFEIDPQWAKYVSETYPDPRMIIYQDNILTLDFKIFEPYKPWVLLSNLPYQITFPILTKLLENRHILKEGVIMVQEEVAQKIMKTSGRGYGFPALYFNHFFEWKLMQKVPPTVFYPPPKVNSRLLYFKPRQILDYIPDEQNFWKFIKRCFAQPRRTLRNNLAGFDYDLSKVSEETLNLRAQQMSKKDFLDLWQLIRPK